MPVLQLSTLLLQQIPASGGGPPRVQHVYGGPRGRQLQPDRWSRGTDQGTERGDIMDPCHGLSTVFQ